MIKALDAGAQIILTGRCYDPAVFTTDAIRKGYDPWLAIHMGKILKYCAIAAEPGSDSALGTLLSDRFIVQPLNTNRHGTVTSVAVHILYEKTNSYELPGPGSTLSLQDTTFEQHTKSTVKVYGSKLVVSDKYTVKLEGAKSWISYGFDCWMP